MTIDELMAGKQPGEIKITNPVNWGHDRFFQPFFKVKSMWYGIENGQVQDQFLCSSQGWELWQEPKKKVTRYLWVSKGINHRITNTLYSEDEYIKEFSFPEEWVRLTWSATEMDE